MNPSESEINEINTLNANANPAEAERRLRRLISRLPRHELIKLEHALRNCVNRFFKKRQRALDEVLNSALRIRPAELPTREAKRDVAGAPEAKPTAVNAIVPADAPTSTARESAPQPLHAKDLHTVLQELQQLPVANRADGVAQLVRTIAHLANTELPKDVAQSLDVLVSSAPDDERRVVAACIARSIAQVDWLQDMPAFRHTTMRLLDELWAKSTYRSIKVAESDQTFTKWQQISRAIRDLDEQIREIVKNFDSLAMLASVRQELKKTLNGDLARATVWPLTGRDLVTQRLDDVFSKVAEYLASSPSAASEARSRALDALTDYMARAKEASSHVVRDLLANCASRIVQLLDTHFENSPLSKPADIVVSLASKKYPLNAVDTECRIGIAVTSCGQGHAFDVEVEYAFARSLRSDSTRQYLGNLQPGQVVEPVELPCRVVVVGDAAWVEGCVRWTNHDSTTTEKVFHFDIQSQPTDINWPHLETLDPYSLEPVLEERELFGRSEQLNQLTAKLTAKSVGSFFVFGQKRVGKTSLVRTLESRLKGNGVQELLVVYLDGGDYVHQDAVTTIQRLGERLCEEIRSADRRFSTIPTPSFDGALSPIDGFLRAVLQVAPAYRIVFILDEFDELPVNIYRRGPIGDAFFLTLRSISAKAQFGFVLVGGEKMEFILSTQGDALNKFTPLRVDYLDRDKHWSDFKELVRRPTDTWLEIADDALVALYDASAGNPFFAKLLCDEMFRMVVQRRDAHITAPEIRETLRRALASAGSNRFSHFWEDGIFEETGDKVEERSMERRHVLLAIADLLRKGESASQPLVIQAASRDGLSERDVVTELALFERRKVLENHDGNYRCKVGFFGQWLRERGVQEIVTTFTDRTSSLERRAEEERQRIPEADLARLSKSWGLYKGQPVGPEAIRSWLAQCGNVAEQRLMFSMLQSIRFYTTAQIRSKMQEAHGIVDRRLGEQRIRAKTAEGQRKRHDIIVSHLGGVAKSGVRYGQLYADENRIIADSVFERDRLSRALTTIKDITALVFVDDFIGSGGSAIEAFSGLSDDVKSQIRRSDIVVVYVVVCGFEAGRARLEDALERESLPVHVHLCDQLTEADRCFSDNSRVFPDPEERTRARDIAESLGRRLVKNNPLGYADCQALIVFDTNCPNNSLPILWEETANWKALFRRQ